MSGRSAPGDLPGRPRSDAPCVHPRSGPSGIWPRRLANLAACPAPIPITMRGWPGAWSRMKSPVRRHVVDTGPAVELGSDSPGQMLSQELCEQFGFCNARPKRPAVLGHEPLRRFPTSRGQRRRYVARAATPFAVRRAPRRRTPPLSGPSTPGSDRYDE